MKQVCILLIATIPSQEGPYSLQLVFVVFV